MVVTEATKLKIHMQKHRGEACDKGKSMAKLIAKVVFGNYGRLAIALWREVHA